METACHGLSMWQSISCNILSPHKKMLLETVNAIVQIRYFKQRWDLTSLAREKSTALLNKTKATHVNLLLAQVFKRQVNEENTVLFSRLFLLSRFFFHGKEIFS